MSLFNKFPFKDKPNAAVITCNHVIDEGQPILYVTHDADDGCWQFLCGKTHSTEDAKIVALEEIYNMDKSLKEIANLGYGEKARREDKNNMWYIIK